MDVQRKGFRCRNLPDALSRRSIRYSSFIKAMQPSFGRVLVVHEAHDVQGNGSDGGELLMPSQRSVPRPILVHRDIRHPMKALPDQSVDAVGSSMCLTGFSAFMTM